LHDKERDRATRHQKIFITQPESIDSEKLWKDIEEFERLSGRMDDAGIVKKIKEMIPIYTPDKKWGL